MSRNPHRSPGNWWNKPRNRRPGRWNRQKRYWPVGMHVTGVEAIKLVSVDMTGVPETFKRWTGLERTAARAKLKFPQWADQIEAFTVYQVVTEPEENHWGQVTEFIRKVYEEETH